MKFYLHFFIVSLSLCISKGGLPGLNTIKTNLIECNFFKKEYINTMCQIQSDSCGLWYWKSNFLDVYNSELSEEEQSKPLGLLLALGIVQIDAKDQQLIDRIKAEMGKWQAEDKKALEKAKVGFSFQDLEDEFESRSRSSSPKDSNDE